MSRYIDRNEIINDVCLQAKATEMKSLLVGNSVKRMCCGYKYICDMIKLDQSFVGKIDFKI